MPEGGWPKLFWCLALTGSPHQIIANFAPISSIVSESMIHSILFHSTIFIIQNIRNAIVIYDFLYQKLTEYMRKCVHVWQNGFGFDTISLPSSKSKEIFSRKKLWDCMISIVGSERAGQVGVTISIKTFFVRFPAVPIWISLHQFKTCDQFRLHFCFTRFINYRLWIIDNDVRVVKHISTRM